ncbi:BRO-N domain-containing protein [Pseudomonas tohonis]|uniref:BRO-N domain-containing protein n=1 Tax=Pseudomonas tohonis TaxID=2725477 RepID=UPI001F35017E|nr:Bro-N domain-containing protein [Pseudomonas tohonis]
MNNTAGTTDCNVQARTGDVIPFSFEKKKVRTLLVDDQPWFVAVDVAIALQYSEASAMTRHLDDDEKGLSIVQTLGGDQEVLVINESGLYSAILRSRKAEAKRFKKWVTAEVLPAIRKRGRYEDQGKMQTLLGETIGTDAVHALGNLVKGKVCTLPVALRRQATAKIWSQTHAAFGVRSAADIPAAQLDSVRNFIAAYALEGEWLPKQPEGGYVITASQAYELANLLHCAAWVEHRWKQGIGEGLKAMNRRMWSCTVEHVDRLGGTGRRLDQGLKAMLEEVSRSGPRAGDRPDQVPRFADAGFEAMGRAVA